MDSNPHEAIRVIVDRSCVMTCGFGKGHGHFPSVVISVTSNQRRTKPQDADAIFANIPSGKSKSKR
jgi:hypothetical protein